MPFLPVLRFKVQRSTFNEKRVHWCTGALVHRDVFSIFLAIAIFASGCSMAYCSPTHAGANVPVRIVSLAPSITEILFALDLGDRVAGVTRYCDYPPETASKPVIGGYFDVNYEMVLSLQPDLVILLKEDQSAILRLRELKIPTLAVDHSRVYGILKSITDIARRCGVEAEGKRLRTELVKRVRRVDKGFDPSSPLPLSTSSDKRDRPRVLVAVGRFMEKGSTGNLFISGRDGFYDDLIALAGGKNAYEKETLKFPAISEEGLVRLDPDLIIEMVPDLNDVREKATLMKLWQSKRDVRAVREGNVYILGQDYVVVPGPRFVDLLEEMAGIIKSVEGSPSASSGSRAQTRERNRE